MKFKNALLFCLFSVSVFSQNFQLEFFSGPFSFPVEITHPVNDDRLFVVEQSGKIYIVNPSGSYLETPFLDLSALVLFNGERGLLGLAFHPEYASNGYFYVNYNNVEGDTVIARYQVSENPNSANQDSQLILMTIDQPFEEHKGGTLKFGPDGYLYIAMGDGGGAGDPFNSSQNLTVDPDHPSRVYLGKILRIDVNSGTPYGIPPTNPLVGQTGKEAIWAYGLRNPWKFSFSRSTGDLWLADVGQEIVEEVNRINYPFSNELTNFGWRCYEGTMEYNMIDCTGISGVQYPFAYYTHEATEGCSITGGYQYNGSWFPELVGKYVFADFCNGKIGTVDQEGTLTWSETLPVNLFTTLGEDRHGELYIATLNVIYRLNYLPLNTSTTPLNSVSIFPNPATNELFVKNDSNIPLTTIAIHDITGKKVVEQNATLSSVNITHLSRGMYFVTLITTSGNTVTKKLLKQ